MEQILYPGQFIDTPRVNPFNNPLARARYNAGDMSEIVITECYGRKVLALIDLEEPSGLLHLHNIGEGELDFLELDTEDVQSFEQLREPIN